MIYDIIVVGNGLAAQTFLFELFNDVKKSQNFSVAQIFSEEIAPSCSLRTLATVSLSGIEEGISDLGNELYSSFFMFEEFVNKHAPQGIERVEQIVSYTTPKEKGKMERRYKKLHVLTDPLFKEEFEGVRLNSYITSPEIYSSWFDEKINNHKIDRIKNFVNNVNVNDEGIVECTLLSGKKILARKILLCTGAYSKIFSDFYETPTILKEKTHSVAGSFLERSIDLNRPSFFVVIDGLKLVYRSEEKLLTLGVSSTQGAFLSVDFNELNSALDFFHQKLNLSLGTLSDFKVKTGLRHKGIQRRPFYAALHEDKPIYLISGLYKNGFTFAHLTAREMLKNIL